MNNHTRQMYRSWLVTLSDHSLSVIIDIDIRLIEKKGAIPTRVAMLEMEVEEGEKRMAA
jgi:hypothetical protein